MSMIIVIPPDQFLLEISEDETEKSIGEKFSKKYFPNVSEYVFKILDEPHFTPGTAIYCEFTAKVCRLQEKVDISDFCIVEDEIYIFYEEHINIYDTKTLTFLTKVYNPFEHCITMKVFYSSEFLLICNKERSFSVFSIKENKVILQKELIKFLGVDVIIHVDKIICMYRNYIVVYNLRGEILKEEFNLYEPFFHEGVIIDAKGDVYNLEFERVYSKKIDDTLKLKGFGSFVRGDNYVVVFERYEIRVYSSDLRFIKKIHFDERIYCVKFHRDQIIVLTNTNFYLYVL